MRTLLDLMRPNTSFTRVCFIDIHLKRTRRTKDNMNTMQTCAHTHTRDILTLDEYLFFGLGDGGCV